MDIKEYDRLLRTHDWYYQYSDDIKVWSRGSEQQKLLEATAGESASHRKLWEAYRAKDDSKEPNARAQLDTVRVEVGAVTQAELDAAVEAKRLAELREQQLQRLELVQYDRLCDNHDWFYWKNRCDTPAYMLGLEQRQQLSDGMKYGRNTEQRSKLFRAWANYFNNPSLQTEAALEVLRRQLQLLP